MKKRLTKEWSYGKDIAALIIRAVLGIALFYGHGFGKWQNLLGDGEIQFMDPIGIGVTASLLLILFAEGICSLLVVVGLFTRWALLPIMIAMAVVIFVVHINDGFARIEIPLLYFAGFSALLYMGPGRISLDHMLFKK